MLQRNRTGDRIQEILVGGIDIQHDTLADAISLIKNAEKAGKPDCIVKPSSKMVGRIMKVMQDNGYIGQFEHIEDGKGGKFKVSLLGNINDCGIIKPRYSVKKTEIEKFEYRYLPAQDFGILILTTTKGIISNATAKSFGVGGKLLAYIY